MITLNKGTWRVMRNCCTSGNCITCTKAAPLGTPILVEHIRNMDEKSAKLIAANWKSYFAVAERQPFTP